MFELLFLLLTVIAPAPAQTNPVPGGFRWDFLNIPATARPIALSNSGIVLYADGAVALRYPDGRIVPVNVPGLVSANSVNSQGTVGGLLNDGQERGFLRPLTGDLQRIDVPTASASEVVALGDEGVLLLRGMIGRDTRFYLRNGSVLEPLLNLPAPPVTMNRQSAAGVFLDTAPRLFFADRNGTRVEAIPECPMIESTAVSLGGVNDANDAVIHCSWLAGLARNRVILRFNDGRSLVLGNGQPSGATTPISLLQARGINQSLQILGVAQEGSAGGRLGPVVLTPCSASISSPILQIPAAGALGTLPVTADAGCRWIVQAPPWVRLSPAGAGSGLLTYTVEENTTPTLRGGEIRMGTSVVEITQSVAACNATVSVDRANFSAAGGQGTAVINAAQGCEWTFVPGISWINLGGPASGTGSAIIPFTVAPNTLETRTGNLVVNNSQVTLRQSGPAGCPYSLSRTEVELTTTATVFLTANPGCPYMAVSSEAWLTVTPSSGAGDTTLNLSAAANPTASPRTATMTVGGQTLTVRQQGNRGPGLRFVPLPPCRVLDTRTGAGALPPGVERQVSVHLAGCGVPSGSSAYSLNATVVPNGFLGFLTLWPSGQPRPNTSTLNAWNGRVVANGAIVPAGSDGNISLFASDRTHLILDVNGYFTNEPVADALAFYPLAPCRIADTRTGSGRPFGYGAPRVSAGGVRTFNVPGARCGAPIFARAFAITVTAVPTGFLGFVTVWPAGSPRPLASTLNSWDGQVVPNTAIVPAGSNGEISVFASDDTDIIIDISGYFSAPGQSGGLRFYPQTPCRVVDTRLIAAPVPFPGSVVALPQSRFAACNSSAEARAFALNITAAPAGFLGFVTVFPSNTPQPFVSTLNSWNGQVVANSALVPAGPAGSGVSFFVSDRTDLIVDVNGYFEP